MIQAIMVLIVFIIIMAIKWLWASLFSDATGIDPIIAFFLTK